MSGNQTAWSEDGQWFWDGAEWNEAVSPDGRYIYNGSAWEPFTGERTPMPQRPAPAAQVESPASTDAPPSQGAAAGADPPAAARSAAAPSDEYPAWLAASEVQRLEAEKARRRETVRRGPAQHRDIDWERMHDETRARQTGRLGKLSKFLVLVVLVWALLIFLALYGLFVYLPGHQVVRGH